MMRMMLYSDFIWVLVSALGCMGVVQLRELEGVLCWSA